MSYIIDFGTVTQYQIKFIVQVFVIIYFCCGATMWKYEPLVYIDYMKKERGFGSCYRCSESGYNKLYGPSVPIEKSIICDFCDGYGFVFTHDNYMIIREFDDGYQVLNLGITSLIISIIPILLSLLLYLFPSPSDFIYVAILYYVVFVHKRTNYPASIYWY